MFMWKFKFKLGNNYPNQIKNQIKNLNQHTLSVIPSALLYSIYLIQLSNILVLAHTHSHMSSKLARILLILHTHSWGKKKLRHEFRTRRRSSSSSRRRSGPATMSVLSPLKAEKSRTATRRTDGHTPCDRECLF